MTAFRFGILLTIAYFATGWLFPSSVSYADEPVIRKAATRSPAQDVQKFRPSQKGEAPHPPTKGRMGLAPVPYTPEPAAGAAEPKGEEPTEEIGPRHLGYPDIRKLIKKVNESVVSIRMLETGSSWSMGGLRGAGDPNGKALGYGSGFIVSRNGHIITNEHVLRSGSQIEVELLNGQKYPAKVLHKDGKNDLALIKITAADLRPVQLGNSDSVELGEWVIGIGNPYGIGQSIMIGIVSAQRRSIPGSGYPPLIQIDAAMNLGNSGGPLFNMAGEVIGINTILLWKSQGIGFATPINVAREFLARKTQPSVRAASASVLEPLGPASDQPRALQQPFNPLDPPWRFRR